MNKWNARRMPEMMRAGKPENAEECAKMKLFMSNINKKTSFFLQEFIALWGNWKKKPNNSYIYAVWI